MVTGKVAPRLSGLDSVQGAIDTIEQYFENQWTDGLPIVPPTEALVDRMVEASGRDPTDVLGVVPPRLGILSSKRLVSNSWWQFQQLLSLPGTSTL